MRHRLNLLVSIVSILLCGSAAAVDMGAIKDKLPLCAACHGENGVSQMANTPSLAGQPDQYLQWQLVFFRAGARKSEQMSAVAENLTNEDVRTLSGYFAALPPPPATTSDDDPALTDAGAKVAVGRRCASCHTDNFAGTKATARTAHQREDYLLKALTDYKTGVRSGGGMAAMADVAYPLSQDEIKALAHYLAHYK